MRILLIGSGGREHALARALAASPLCEALYAAPGNPGIAQVARCVDAPDPVAFALEHAVDLVVVGPEGPLVDGLADRLRAAGVAVFGPSAAAARLEGSKGFMKDLCAAQGIPTAAYARFTEYDAAADYIRARGAPIVVKADGLAAGKGVTVAATVDEALAAARAALTGEAFGDAGRSVVVEGFLDGEEVSFFALSDGRTVRAFGSAQDHKRVGAGDTGPNTGGMGAYAPAPVMSPALEAEVMARIVEPTIAGLAARGAPFVGVLFAGLMIVDGAPYLIEHNVRFGDPECQVLLARLDGDLAAILDATARGRLAEVDFAWREEAALCVVMAARGYPGTYETGSLIKGTGSVTGSSVLHAGTAISETGQLVSAGGRALNIVATGPDVAAAQRAAYAAVGQIDWPGGFCRPDIGWRAV
jgi:phosphoribosylamine---glycine ligase